MMAHWRYMIDRLAAPVTGVCALMATAIPERVDEQGRTYTVDAEDTSHALLQLAGGAVGVITNSWATRIRRDDTMVVQIDGTLGSAVAGRFRCFTQAAVNTPEAFFGGGRPSSMDFHAQWQEVPDTLPTQQSVPPMLGGVPAPCRRGCALRPDFGGRGEGGAARRSRLSQRRRGAMDGGAGAEFVRLLVRCTGQRRVRSRCGQTWWNS